MPARRGHEEWPPDAGSIVRATARGLVAAMAMTGLRRVTGSLGLMTRTPPEALVHSVQSVERRRESQEVIVELTHWAVGASAGATFGALPSRVRRSRLSGPAYGIAIWLAFDTTVAPLLGIRYPEEGPVRTRLSLIADHLLYGVIVGGRLAPEPPASAATRRRR